jgi:hypothetical protein
MLKGKINRIYLLILMIAFCLNLSFPAHAEEDCGDAIRIPTNPGNADYSNMETLRFDPNNDDEITCGTPITLSVIGGLPPLDCQVSGNGYSLEETEDERTYNLSCTGDTWGEDYAAVATVTVTDSCDPEENEITTQIRNSGGEWSNLSGGGDDSVHNPNACGGSTNNSCAGCTCTYRGPCEGYTCSRCMVRMTQGRYKWCISVSGAQSSGGCSCDPPPDWAWEDGATEPQPPCGCAGACYYSYEELQDHSACIPYLKYYVCEWSCP